MFNSVLTSRPLYSRDLSASFSPNLTGNSTLLLTSNPSTGLYTNEALGSSFNDLVLTTLSFSFLMFLKLALKLTPPFNSNLSVAL